MSFHFLSILPILSHGFMVSFFDTHAHLISSHHNKENAQGHIGKLRERIVSPLDPPFVCLSFIFYESEEEEDLIANDALLLLVGLLWLVFESPHESLTIKFN